jgi:hypothetical protein
MLQVSNLPKTNTARSEQNSPCRSADEIEASELAHLPDLVSVSDQTDASARFMFQCHFGALLGEKQEEQ